MQVGYYAAAGAMVSQFNRLDTIANNLANVNTAGYKKDALVTSNFSRIYQEACDNSASKKPVLGSVPQNVEGYIDHSVGTLEKTDNTFDFALMREGFFFAVKTPHGVRLTRNGTFTLNEAGMLVSREGYEVLSDEYFNSGKLITLKNAGMVIEVNENGRFTTNSAGSDRMIKGANLMIVRPEDLTLLQKEGASLYRTETMKELTVVGDSGAVAQGFTEKSNVNAVSEMISLIEANRLAGMLQKAMDAQMNDLNRDAIEKLAYVRR